MNKPVLLFSICFCMFSFAVLAFPLSSYASTNEAIESSLAPLNSYGADGSYIVKGSDTLFGIAFSHNIAVSKLKELNHLSSGDLFVGQILKVSNVQKLEGDIVVIDPGHGGYETGAIQNDVEEQHATLDVSLKLKRHLESEGAKVIMTRENALTPFETLPLAERAAIPFQGKADLFVSVHFNSHPDKSVQGTETYFNETPYKGEQNPFPTESKELATHIQNSLVQGIRTTDLGVKENNFHVLRNNTVPSALVEVSFLSNPTEAERIQKDRYKEEAAYGISKGIVGFFNR